MVDVEEDCTVLDSQRPSQCPAKCPHYEKTYCSIVDYVLLASLVAAYTTNFATYNKGKTNVTQLVPKKVWKLVYDQFLREHHGSKFAEEMLKDRLWETLKELKKSGTSNEEGSNRAILHANDILTYLKNTNSHATLNILKLRQSMLDQALGVATSPSMFSQPSSCGILPSQVQDAPAGMHASLHQAPTCSPSPSSTQKLPSKAELLVAQSRSMQSIARSMEARTEGKEALFSLKMDIEIEKKNQLKLPT